MASRRDPKASLEFLGCLERTVHLDTLETLECRERRETKGPRALRAPSASLGHGG